MCEYLHVNLTNEERKIFNSMYAKMVLYRIYGTLESRDVKNNYEKDWTFPACCNQYFGEKNVLFSDFLEGININSPEPFVYDPTNEYFTSFLKLTKEIFLEEGDISQPILKSIQIAIDTVNIPLSKTRKDLNENKETLKYISALTRLFYLPTNTSNPFYEEDMNLFFKAIRSKNERFKEYFNHKYIPLLFLTLLSRQNICPHISRFTAFLTCIPNEKNDLSSSCKKTWEKSDNIKVIHFHEYPTLSLISWITEPKIEDAIRFDSFQLQRPVLLEIENILFQITFILYIFATFQINIFLEKNEKIGDIVMQMFRLFKCQEVKGYDRYRTLNDVYYVPNYGNFLLFTQSLPNGFETGKGKGERFFVKLQIGEEKFDIYNILQIIVENFKAYVEVWNNNEFLLSEESNHEISNEKPIPHTIQNEKDQIIAYLNLFQAHIEKFIPLYENWKDYDFYHSILYTWFEKFRSDLPHPKDVQDLILINDYGFHPTRKVQIPAFLYQYFELQFQFKAGETVDFQKFVEISSNPLNFVETEIQSISLTLQSFNPLSSKSLLFQYLYDQMGTFLSKTSLTSSSITDRYSVSVEQLNVRKKLRQYGHSFLLLLEKLTQTSGIIGIHPLESRKWQKTAEIKDLFAKTIENLVQIQPEMKNTLQTLLKVGSPMNLRSFLNVLLLTAYLQRVGKKKESKMISEFADFFNLNVKELEKNLKWVEEKFGLPDDIHIIIKELIQKLNQEKPSYEIIKPYSLFDDNSKQRNAFESFENEIHVNEMDFLEKRLNHLKKKITTKKI